MTSSFERRLVEASFLVVLAAATAALHYVHSFHSPFPRLTGAPVRHDPAYNYVLVLGVAGAVYLGTRVLCAVIFAAVPASIKSNHLVQRGAFAAVVPAAVFALYIAAGSPALENHVLAKWLAWNWQQRGRKDVEWCLRLLLLLICWQGLLGLTALVCWRVWLVLDGLILALVSSWGRDEKAPSGAAPPHKDASRKGRELVTGTGEGSESDNIPNGAGAATLTHGAHGAGESAER